MLSYEEVKAAIENSQEVSYDDEPSSPLEAVCRAMCAKWQAATSYRLAFATKYIGKDLTLTTKHDLSTYHDTIAELSVVIKTWSSAAKICFDVLKASEYFEPIEADVRPVKCGHWDDGVCSECGCEAYDGYTSNFCPDYEEECYG